MLETEKQQEVHLFPKVNRMWVFPQWKCCVSCVGGMLDRRCANVQCIGRRCDQGLCGRPENYINQGRVWPRQNKAERQRGFTEKLHCHPCVCISGISDTYSLTLRIHTSQVIKKGRKETDYIFIQQCCCSFLYTIICHKIHFT